MDINELLAIAISKNASDLHICAGDVPLLRIDGDLKRIDAPTLNKETAHEWLYSTMTQEQRHYFEQNMEIDFSYEIADGSRFRVNIFQQAYGIAGAFRTILLSSLSFEDLGLPTRLKEITKKSRGLVLVTGPTGSGKSTTLAAILDHINETTNKHILTIEDPIEFMHKSKHCLVNQREVHQHTHSFADALRSALRQDPDIILVGEMRDIETIRLALTAAETGHLVFATLHTISAAKTINRIIDVFPGDEKAMVRSMLSNTLEAVIAQTLLKRIDGGRIAATEVMLCNNAVRHLIREDKIAQLYSVIQTGTRQGMHTLDQNLQTLVANNKVSLEHAKEIAVNKDNV